MNSQDIYNLHEAYIGVYYDLEEKRAPEVPEYKPNRLNPLPAALPLSGETGDGSGYGKDEKFTQDTDAKSFKPGTTVPKVKQFGRISRIIPHGIGAHANRNRSRNSTIRGLDPGAPRSEKLRKLSPEETQKKKKKPSTEIVRKPKTNAENFELWVNNLLDEGYDLSGYTWEGLYEEYIQNEAYDIYDVILSHLIDEGYADTFESAEAIMVNMSEEWRESIVEEVLDEAYVDYRKGKLSTGRSPKETVDSRLDRLKARATKQEGENPDTTPPARKKSRTMGPIKREMDAHTSLGGVLNKAISPGLGNRAGASPRVAYGEPNTDRHQMARFGRGEPSTKG